MQNNAKRASIFLGVFMIFVLVAGAIIPIFTRGMTTTVPQIPPTAAPTATFPPPPAPESISFNQQYLHPSALFTIAQPEGWTVSEPISEPGRAAITMVNNDALSVIEASVEAPATPITTLEELDNRYDESFLDASWARYSNWEETARRVEDDKLVIDFNLTLNRQIYVARQKSWTDGDWIYSIRVVTPNNATQLLVHLLNELVSSVEALKQFAGTPFDWVATYDTVANHVIRHPNNWTVQDTAPGAPTSIVGPNGIALRIEARPDSAIASAADAEAWVRSVRPNARILSVEPVERGDAKGWSVAYADRTIDGDPQSGLAVLLNGPDGTLHTANLSFLASEVDLNKSSAPEPVAAAEATPEATAEPGQGEYAELAQVMNTFFLLPQINLISAETTPTPLPAAATEDATAETEEAASDAGETDASATEEAE